MNWLLGGDPKSISFMQCYWQKETPVPPIFSPFINKNSIFLDTYGLKSLHAITFLNDEYPFGKIDLFSNVGMIDSDLSENLNFENEINKSLAIINSVPSLKNVINNSIKCFIPLKKTSEKFPLRENGSGKSAHWFKGAVFLSLPVNDETRTIELALNIIHEAGHQVLMVYQDADNIITDINKLVYSSIRKTDRPAIMSFHALVAIYFMIFLIENLKPISLEADIYLDQRKNKLVSDFIGGSFALKDIEFTQLGLSLFNEMISFVLSVKSAA